MFDTMRGMIVDGNDAYIRCDTAADENDGSSFIEPTSTGFNIENLGTAQDFIYIAIRRPFKPPEAATDVFALDTYTGSSTLPFEAPFAPDLAFIKKQTSSSDWFWSDRHRGGNALSSNNTSAESAGSAYKLQFRGAFSSSWTDYNGYMFKRAPGFFDVVTYEGNGQSNRQISHNLGAVPQLIIVKQRNATRSWGVYSAVTGTGKFLKLEGSDAAITQSGVFDTAPTSSIFTVETNTYVNINNGNYVAYLFGSLDGISKVGSYSGSSYSVNVDCGFTNGARFVMIKRTDTTGSWVVFDTQIGIVSGNDPYFQLNTNDAYVTNYDAIDYLASGFTINSGNGNYNTNGGNYIFLAIA